MRPFLFLTVTISLLFSSCEKDYIEDVDCRDSGGYVPGWVPEKPDSTEMKKDSINGAFEITVNEWGDTIWKNVTL